MIIRWFNGISLHFSSNVASKSTIYFDAKETQRTVYRRIATWKGIDMMDERVWLFLRLFNINISFIKSPLPPPPSWTKCVISSFSMDDLSDSVSPRGSVCEDSHAAATRHSGNAQMSSLKLPVVSTWLVSFRSPKSLRIGDLCDRCTRFPNPFVLKLTSKVTISQPPLITGWYNGN